MDALGLAQLLYTILKMSFLHSNAKVNGRKDYYLALDEGVLSFATLHNVEDAQFRLSPLTSVAVTNWPSGWPLSL